MRTTQGHDRAAGSREATLTSQRSFDPTLVPRVLLLTGVFLAPILVDVRTVRPFDVVKITALWVFALAALGLWLMEVILRQARPVFFPLGVLAGLFVFTFGVATIFSRTPLVSFFGWYGRYSGFLQYALYAVISVLIAQLYWGRPQRLREVIYVLGAAATVVIAYLVVQMLGFDPINWRSRSRPQAGLSPNFGTLGNTNFTGGFLGATSPWLLFAFWRARRRTWRAVVAVWGAVTFLAVMATGSRGGLLALMAGAAVAVFVFRARFPRWLLIGGAAAAVLAAGVVLAVVLRPADTGPRLPLPGGSDLLRSETLRARTLWWRSALSIVASSPVVGTGPDTFVVVFGQHMPPEAAGLADAELADKPHNVFLDHAVSAGLLGAGAYVALLAVAGLWGVGHLRRAGPEQRELLGTFLAVGAGYCGQAFFSIDIVPLAMLVWIALGGVAAIADPRLVAARERARGSTVPGAGRPGALRWSAAGLAALVAALAIVGGMRPWRADRAMKAGQTAARAGDLAEAERRFEETLDLFGAGAMYPGLVGDAILRQAGRFSGEDRLELGREAVRYLERLNELHPHFFHWKMTLGEALGWVGASGEPAAFFEAAAVFDEATQLAPYDWRVHQRYGEVISRWAQSEGNRERYCLALEKLDRSLELRDNDPRTWRALGVTYGSLGRFDLSLSSLERSLVMDPESQEAIAIRTRVLELRDRNVAPVDC